MSERERQQKSDAWQPMSEDSALAMLQSRDLDSAKIEGLASDPILMRSRKIMLALARHIRTPRHVSIPLVRQLFVFELMQVAMSPSVATDIRSLAEECIVRKISSLALGERISLAKRASGRVAAALLTDADIRVREAALHNPQMTEMYVVKALMRPGVPKGFVTTVKHSKWSVRVEVQRAIDSIEGRSTGDGRKANHDRQ